MGIFDRYRKVGLLGQGGMGQVFLAFDPILERYVAIKQIGQAIIDHAENVTLLGYFEREAKVVAALQHPNIIQVFEFGQPSGEPAYIVTEFVDGITFEELIESRPVLSPSAVLALLLPVAEALEYAHAREIIHRDLKPGNVMISRHGRVYLMDFGLAKPMGSSSLKSMIIGSPAFMAPEQIEGKETDRRTDVFAFGLLAWALATGDLFFSAEAPRAFIEILTEEYPKPSHFERLGSPELVELLRGTVQRDPMRRFDGMQPIIDLIERSLPALGVYSGAREVRKMAESWAPLMPQQYTLGATGAAIRDTSPVDRFALGPDVVASDRFEVEPESDSEPIRGELLPPGHHALVASEAETVAEFVLPQASEAALRREADVPPPAGRVAIDHVATRPAAWSDHADVSPLAFHAASTVVVPADGHGNEDTPTEPRIDMRAVRQAPAPPTPVTPPTPAPSPKASGTAVPADPVAALDRTRRRLFVPTAPTTVGARASFVEIPAAIDDADPRLVALLRSATPTLGKRLLWLFASLGGEASFAELRPLLSLIDGTDAREVGSALASLVDVGFVEQRGDDAIGLRSSVTATDILGRIGRDPALPRVRGAILTHFLSEARDARLRCDPDEVETWLTRAATVVRADPDVPTVLVADVLLQLADAELAAGRRESARGLLDDVFGLRGTSPATAVRLRIGFAHLYDAEGRLERAFDALTDGAAAALEAGEDWLWATVALHQGELQIREAELRRARARLESIGDRLNAGPPRLRCALALAEVISWLDDPAAAAHLLDDAINHAEGDDVGLETRALVGLGALLTRAGQFTAAESRLEQARGTARALGLRAAEVETLVALADLARIEGQPEDAVRHARRALALATTLRDSRRHGLAAIALSRALLDAGELDAARQSAEAALALLAPWRFDRYPAELAMVGVSLADGAHREATSRIERLDDDVTLRGMKWPLVRELRRALSGASPRLRGPGDLPDCDARELHRLVGGANGPG
ncbi:MAG: serine/threonine protein kinase [Myxococcales bacterium]|nr:serine/threonine protein kinase [Myxococcales bacterium]